MYQCVILFLWLNTILWYEYTPFCLSIYQIAGLLGFSPGFFSFHLLAILNNTVINVLSHSVMPNSTTPWSIVHQAPLCMGIFQARVLEWGACPPSRDLPNLGIESRSPTLQADSFPCEPPGKPKNTGVGSLSLLQGIFPTQGSNQGLPHYRQILYQLSHQGSPWASLVIFQHCTLLQSKLNTCMGYF